MKKFIKFLIIALLALPFMAQALIPLSVNQGGTGVNTITGIIKGNGTSPFTVASAGTDYEVPLTFSTGLTRSTNTITVNTTQNITKLSNLTSNGFVKTSGGDGTLSVDTNTYLTTSLASSTYVPYSGATGNVDLGSNAFTTTGNVAGNSWIGSTAVRAGAASQIYFNGRTLLKSSADGLLDLFNTAGTDFGRVNFGGVTSSFPALKRSTTDLQFRLADDSAYTNADALAYKLSGTTVLSDTTLGSTIVSSSLTSVGTITTGTWNATAIAFGKGGTGLTSAADDTTIVSSGSAWVATSIPNCTDTGGNHLNYATATNAFSCGTSSSGGGGSGITIGTTTITSGTGGRVLYDNAGVVGEMTTTGSGTVLALATSPAFTTPDIGVATGTSLGLGTSLTSGFTANIGGSVQLGTAFSYTPTAGITDLVVGSASNNSRFLFGQSASTYGGITWNYNATPANSSITFGYNVAGTLTGLTFDPSGNGVFSQGLKVTTPSNVSTSVVTTDGTQTLTNKSIAIGQITGLGTGVATWLATPSSANLASAITDETGSGVAVFGTSPTFTTRITSPIVLGGTGTTSTLTFQTTSGVGTTNADMIFKVGNNGATEALRITNAGALSTSFNVSGNSWLGSTLVRAGAASGFSWNGRSFMSSSADGLIMLSNGASTDFTRLQLGGTTSSFPSLKRNSTAVDFRLADDSAYAPINAGAITGASTITIGTASGTTGAINFKGTTSGTFTETVAAAAGTWTLTWPTTGGSAGQFLQTNGSGTTTWASAGGLIPQDVFLGSGTTIGSGGRLQITSTLDGSVLYAAFEPPSGTVATIYRIVKDTTSNNYYITHTTTLTTSSSSLGGITATSTFLYVNATISGTNAVRRYSLTDLSGVTSMTGTIATRNYMFSDGTDIYIVNNTDTADKYTISGTALTNAATNTYTSAGTINSVVCDGTNVYIADLTLNGTINIRKYAKAGGAASSTTSPILYSTSQYNSLGQSFFMGASNILGIGWGFDIANPTATVGGAIHLMGITLP